MVITKFTITTLGIGPKHFGFVPLTFILPNELNELQEAMQSDPTKQWIVKPSASSQGKGIFLTNTVNDVRILV
jgi:tubulin polyglutamylase TTLL5